MNGSWNRRDGSQTCLYIVLCVFIISSVICLCCNNVETGLRPVSTFYIDSRIGDDKNPGSLKKPIKTIFELNDRLQKKPANIYFAGGQIFEGTLLLEDIQGVDSVPIVIGSYGEGRAVINGGNNESLRIENCNNIRIYNLGLKGSGRKDGNTTNGL